LGINYCIRSMWDRGIKNVSSTVTQSARAIGFHVHFFSCNIWFWRM